MLATASMNMDRNNDLRLSHRGARRAKDFEAEFGRGLWLEFEIVRLAH